MVPLQAGGRRLWRAGQRVRDWSLTVALCVSVILGGVLGRSSLATAQPVSPANDPAFFPATGYRISSPLVLNYFLHHGGARTFGFPVSNEFPLLGHQVQIFQRQMLEIEADGTVTPANILDPSVLPISHIDGLTLPAADPDVVAAAPPTDAPDYSIQALAFINVYVPDDWNGLPVNFQSTFLNTVSCADVSGTDPCDPSVLPSYALELWGLPTSLPTLDPLNADFVYQRFQRGIMHFSRASGQTQGLLLGDWLKRIMIGVDLSPDISPEVRQSRFFAQYAPTRPLALDRPDDLPDTSLAQAFRADSLAVAGQMQPEPSLPPAVAQTASAVALTATSVSGTQVAFQATQTVLSGTQSMLTLTAIAATATAALGQLTATATPVVAVSNIPVVNIGCLGDEQLWFVPRKPNVGVHVDISVTSQRHHDVRFMKLAGPLDPGPVIERVGPLGFVWTWTIVPLVEDFHQWTFYADGLRPCITSGFNSFAPLGATPTPTVTPLATSTPGTATPTPNPTLLPVPSIADQSFTNLACGTTLTIHGNNFGTPPSSFGTFATLVIGSRTFTLQTVGTGSNTQLRVLLPTSGVTSSTAGSATPITTGPIVGQIFVSTSQSDSSSVQATFATGCA
jgi:hypothetical protein